MRVLLIAHDSILSPAILNDLAVEGVRVERVSTGRQGLDHLRHHDVALALLSLTLIVPQAVV